MPTEAVLEAARRWRDHDPDPVTRAELDALIAARSEELVARFSGPLEFGTAGLRGVLGAGESRMNRAVVRKTSQGLARYLVDRVPEAARRGVVVGYDGRRLSDAFAEDTARVLCAAGIRVHLSDGPCPTPLVAFAVRDRGAAAGVMVTASHNPPEYNGYKVYAENGAQIIPPADAAIARAIAATGEADAVPLADLADAERTGLLVRVGPELEERYLDAIASLVPAGGDRSLTIAYTALHGVGNALFLRAMRRAGFEHVHSVASQSEPDGSFPTVAFPNPEEEGVLDRVIELAREVDAALVLANDPDADRLAAAVRTGRGRYTTLSGNEVGILLGHALLAGSDAGPARLVVTTLVSSPLLGVIARAEGARYADTLTGFKWIVNKAMELERDGAVFLFGYEEALGYVVGGVVRDKDGISAGVVLAALAARLHARGETLVDELTRIARRYGLYTSAQRSLKYPGPHGKATMDGLMARLREDPPRTLGGRAVLAISDVLAGLRREGGATRPLDLPPSNVLAFELEGGHRVLARPSGTEPKLKIYFDVVEPLAVGEGLEEARARARVTIEELERDILALLSRAE